MRCEALILDLDGVLADTEPIHCMAWDVVLKDIGAQPIAAHWAALVGTPAAEIARYVVRVLAPGESADALLKRKRKAFRDLLPTVLRPFPGLASELDLWRGMPVACATSGTRRESLLMLEIMGLRGAFRTVVTYEDVPTPKPAPDSYLKAIQLLGAQPSRCAAVEDSPRGAQAAVAAGTITLAVPPAASAPPAGVAGCFPSTVEALQWLRQ